MDLGIQGKVAVVTGASRGLGFASALRLAEEGALVTITGRRPDTLREAAARIEKEAGTEVLALPGDITDPAEPARVVETTVERRGSVDILVANAGGPPQGRSLEVSDGQVLAAVDANLLSSVRLVRAAVPHMERSGGGRICCIASYSVKQPLGGLALSNLARTGLWAWAKTAAQDLAEKQITLNLICPGPHRTERAVELGLVGRMGEAADFGQAAAFLCSAAARFITATTLVVDGGATLGL